MATVHEALVELLCEAPAAARPALLSLVRAAWQTLAEGYRPEVRGVPLHDWREALTLLSAITARDAGTELLLRLTSDLLSISDRMAAPGDVLRQSAEILVRALHASLYVCRLRDRHGEWRLHTVSRADGGAVPLLNAVLEEGLDQHPVMHAVAEGNRYVVTNDLHALERGGGSIDCAVYKAGYRSRLSFVLRERGGQHPFGLVMLLKEEEHGFDQYDNALLGRCARIVSLTVGRRVAVARDTLEKAAGAMAHYGNNILNIIRNQTEFCGELVSSLDEVLTRAHTLTDALAARLPEGTTERELARSLEECLTYADLTRLAGNLGKIQDGGKRMTRLIASLRKSAERPRLMYYALGQHVLELERPETRG